VAVDNFLVYSAVYSNVQDAIRDYETVTLLHDGDQLVDALDAAVIERKDNGKVKIVKKHESTTRGGVALGGGVGLATGLVVALFPAAAIGGGLLLGTSAGGAVIGAIAGHAAAGMSRGDLKEMGEALDAGQAGLVVVAMPEMGAEVEAAMKGADKVETRQLQADHEQLASDAEEAHAAHGGDPASQGT
jgi:uncharacterized membrane protein